MSKFKIGEKIKIHITEKLTVKQIIKKAKNNTLNKLNLVNATVLEYHRFYGSYKGWYKVQLENGLIIYPLTSNMKKIKKNQ